MIHFSTLSAMARANHIEPPEHPMIGLLRVNDQMTVNHPEFTCDCYMIGFKKIKAGYMLYGRTKLDHETGSMIFLRPRQVIEMRNIAFEEDGYILFLHEDFLIGNTLHDLMKDYSFFDYEINEALHLAPKEEKIIWSIFRSIEQEYNNNQDEFSREIMLATINSLLKYAQRFYKRQFINRTDLSGKTISEFNRYLQAYISDGSLEKGLPSASFLAGKLNVSRRYLTDMLKIETGKTALELVHIALIKEAMNRLRTGHRSVSEVAYALGFENMSYFSRLFKRETGLAPMNYRKQFLN